MTGSDPDRVAVTRSHPGPERGRRTSGGPTAFLDVGEGPALVLLRGPSAPPDLWSGVVPFLAGRLRILVPEPPPQGRDPASEAASVLGVLGALGIERFAAAGHGHGGAVAQVLALDHGAECLVLVDSVAFDGSGLEGRDAEMAALDVPALIVWGEDDDVLPVEVADRLAAVLPRAAQVVIPGCGHHLPLEAPETVGPLIAEFLRVQYLGLPHGHDGHSHGASGPIPIDLLRRTSRGAGA